LDNHSLIEIDGIGADSGAAEPLVMRNIFDESKVGFRQDGSKVVRCCDQKKDVFGKLVLEPTQLEVDYTSWGGMIKGGELKAVPLELNLALETPSLKGVSLQPFILLYYTSGTLANILFAPCRNFSDSCCSATICATAPQVFDGCLCLFLFLLFVALLIISNIMGFLKPWLCTV
jgi:hypothetical protein